MTSGLVITLCGVLKNILLVVASILIWGTIVSGLQVLGDGITLVGLVYYGVGYEGVLISYKTTRRFVLEIWEGAEAKGAETIPKRSNIVRNVAIVACGSIVAVIMLLGGMAMRNE